MKPKITWKSAIRLGRARRLTPTMRTELAEAASDWRTCAVGEHLGIWYDDRHFEAINPAVQEVDPILHDLGLRFSTLVNSGRWTQAEKIRQRISRRLSPQKIESIVTLFVFYRRHLARAYAQAKRGGKKKHA